MGPGIDPWETPVHSAKESKEAIAYVDSMTSICKICKEQPEGGGYN